ncbi:MAG: hypothetical protein Q9220_004437 [cf. Caloplaca sp. 1 TL-2023]
MYLPVSLQTTIYVLSGVVFLFSRDVSPTPAVNVVLQASFNSAPYLLELLETAAEENSTAYFPMLDRIADGRFLDCTTDEELYATFLHVLQDDGHVTTPEALSSLQFALSIHSAAPRIEAHYQYYNTSVEPSLMVAQDAACPVWVYFHGRQYCSPALDRAQQDVEDRLKNLEVLPFDRLLGDVTAQSGPSSILYADITSPLFGQFHQTISSTARNGQTSYRVRYRPASIPDGRPLVINGYGVELALKRTDYIVIDDRSDDKGDQMDEKASEVTESGPEEVVFEAEELADLKPLSTSKLRGLGLKTASFVMSSDDPFDTLIKMSQDFPKHSSTITQRNVSGDLLAEHRHNREVLLPAGYNVVWMNGMQVEARQMDAFALLERMRRERSLVDSLRNIGFSGSESVQILSHPSIAESKVNIEVQRYDYRDDVEGNKVIVWLNDIEKDKRYQEWPAYLNALLQRTFPGQLPTIRRNVHNAVIPLDFTDIKDVQLLVESIQAFVKRKVPIRFGVVPTLLTTASQDQAKMIYHLLDTYGLGAVLTYLEASLQSKKITGIHKGNFESTIKDRKVRRDRNVLSFQAVIDDSDLNDKIGAGLKYLDRLGANARTPPLFVNGVAMPRNEGWLQTMSTRVDQDLRSLQREIFEEIITEDASLSEHFLADAAFHRNAFIVPEDENTIRIMKVSDLVGKYGGLYNNLPRVPGKVDTTGNLSTVLLVVANLDSDEGADLAQNAVDFSGDHPEIEIALLHNPAERAAFQPSIVFSKYVKQHGWNISADSTKTILTLKKSFLNQNKPLDLGYGEEEIEAAEVFWKSTRPLVDAVGFLPGERGLVIGGRILGPIPLATNFTKDEFTQLFTYERSKRLRPAMAALQGLVFEDRIETPIAGAIISSVVALSTISDLPEGIFEAAPPLRMAQFHQWDSSYTMIVAGEPETASIHLVASIDPTSEIAQRWIPMLKVLSEIKGVYLRLFLNPREEMQELPVKRFYRHVLDAAPSFNADGTLRDIQATFEGVPKEALLNLGLDVPPAWLVAPRESVHDLDNIKLASLKDGANVDAIYELENILIEGHSRDVTTGPPPRGVQLVLGTEKEPHFADTIIMANLGYFQFKANPGYWKIQLQSGRSSQLFNIDSAGQKGYSPQPGDESTDIALISFQGKTLYPRLSRQPGREEDDVLEEQNGTAGKAMDYLSKAAKFASSMLSTTGLAPGLQAADETQADINIFSVASGHLYERMLNIMMVSVMRHTNHTVKFWFIEQFLSPSFKASLPTLAAQYHFSYALVTYKWPHWLRAQKEKQREIWGYKILFLDVLFPLSLDKVIFVDADQIVRTDMYDLVQHDLEGAPYAFTPMCDSRTEMEGFRFWKQGYWASFLKGLPYHISALYVVDLKLFRQMAAGDRLRQQYHSLSADPASLSNLDQDLPNHMQHVLPIHSLPQEWLWCETWCADEGLETARTIDLCNNPQTKEPKLERARRQVPEWGVYDSEIAEVLKTGRRREGKVPVDTTTGGGSVHGEREKVRDEL